jgi:hypothetical protein
MSLAVAIGVLCVCILAGIVVICAGWCDRE